jgi:hypothetical protein
MSRGTLLATASLMAVAMGSPSVLAADAVRPIGALAQLPAVSTVNGKVGAFGGSIDGVAGWGVDGALTVPLGSQWGAQVDGLAGDGGSSTFWGVGGHLFWRNPAQGLLGLYGSWVDWSPYGVEVSKFGVEGEMYNGPFTLSANVVEQGGTFTGVAGQATLSYYVQDNFRMDGSFRFLQGIGGIGTIGGEWQVSNNGLSLFANGSWGQSGYSTVLAGLTFHAGPPKSLIRREREDDPGVSLPLDLFQACPSGTVDLYGDGCIGKPPN